MGRSVEGGFGSDSPVDMKDRCGENSNMHNINEPIDTMEEDTRAVLDHFVTGKPLDPEVAKRVRERGRRIREEVYEKHGLLDVGVPAIRELRGELPNP